MIRVCCYEGCGVVYGEKEPLSDKTFTHGYCPKHLEVTLSEIKAEMEKRMDRTKQFKTLIVEDSSFFRETFISQLRRRFASIDIDGAGNGGEALQKVEALHPNLIFMDIRLPGESGLELTRKIKASSPDIIIIIFTNYDGLVKSPFSPLFVIPANAGIQLFQLVLDSGFHRSDGFGTFYESINYDLPEYREAATRFGADYFFPKDSSAINDIFELVQSILPARA